MAAVKLSQESLKNWDKSGRNEFVKIFKNSISVKSELSSQNIDIKDVKRLIYDVCNAAITGVIKVENVTSVLSEISNLHHDISSIIADILSLIDFETQACNDKSERERYSSLVLAVTGTVIHQNLIKLRLDVDTLGEAGVVKNVKTVHQKLVRKKTRLFYKQKKFNLFREESEGFGKLITELNQEISGNVNSAYILEVIKSLIGCFNLDPNKVLDVILESFEYNPNLEKFYVELLQSYSCNSDTLSQVLGFKYSSYHKEPDKITPSSLYIVTALLLRNGLISLDEIYPFLYPRDGDIVDQHKKVLTEARTYARRANIIVTSGNNNNTTEQKEDDKETETDKFLVNQKLGLCEALLNIGDWMHAKDIFSRLPNHYATSFTEVAQALCKLVHSTIDPLYRKYHGLSKLVKSKPIPLYKGDHIPPLVESFDQLRPDCLPMIRALGPHLSKDAVLMVKVIRLSKSYILKKSEFLPKNTDDKTPQSVNVALKEDLQYDFLTVIDEVLLPSLSLMECNCCMAEELWNVIKLYPYQQRYLLYGRWKNESYNHHPKLIRTKADSIKKIKYIMKRLVKESVKPTGRQIGKLSHSNPGFLFDFILSQIQAWDNLIGPVVDSLKYLSSLSYDVLAYCIIEALSNPEKEQMKTDGVSIGLWMQSLSIFCGFIFKKYNIDLTGLLQYVTNQLKAEKSLDLLILREVIHKMAGIEASEEVTDNQLEAMSGGELLKAEGGYFSQVRNTKKSSQRLKEALVEQDLALPLCLLMAQERHCILYSETSNKLHIKLSGNLYDQCQDTLVQFGNFLSTTMSMDDYVRRVPPLHQLLSDYHIMDDVAFFLARPMVNYILNSKYDELRKQDKGYRNATTSQKVEKYKEACRLVMNPIVESIEKLHPVKVWEDISPRFFVTFWSLTGYDLYIPSGCYENEMNKIRNQIQQVEDNKELAPSKKKKQKDNLQNVIEKLTEEERKQQEHVARVLVRLESERESWFVSRIGKNETVTQLLKMCLFPRCIFTANDAIYCAKFINVIHTLKTPNFSTLICYDRIFCDITYTLTSLTENEAHRYGRFLSAVLETVMRWHSSKAIFDKECSNFPGFMTKFRGSTQTDNTSSDHVDYENYRHVCHKWHFKITKALVLCLESENYVQIRNTLIVLTKIIFHYPRVANLGQALERRIEKKVVEEKDKRPDLYAKALSYAGQLKNRKSTFVQEHEFHQKEVKDAIVEASRQVNTVVKTGGERSVKTEPNVLLSHHETNGVVKDKKPFTGRQIVKIDSSTRSSTSINPAKANHSSSGAMQHNNNAAVKREKDSNISVKSLTVKTSSDSNVTKEKSKEEKRTLKSSKRQSLDPPSDIDKDYKRMKTDAVLVKMPDNEHEGKTRERSSKKDRSKSNSNEPESDKEKKKSKNKEDRERKSDRKHKEIIDVGGDKRKRDEDSSKSLENGEVQKKMKTTRKIVVKEKKKDEKERRHHRSSSKKTKHDL